MLLPRDVVRDMRLAAGPISSITGCTCSISTSIGPAGDSASSSLADVASYRPEYRPECRAVESSASRRINDAMRMDVPDPPLPDAMAADVVVADVVVADAMAADAVVVEGPEVAGPEVALSVESIE